ncbi:MAG: tRNA pseudouridine(38-40) synthase TruA [Proteobacteria bacterium]|nr:tRNA pseudouridine(38-40) synthase TruA [Pseudomonadota bacterium]MBU1386572.1 tRNA pseudouridine(38-40) synthase TruA [Pseudomonadota bacterium]MBU1542473.1 tRNA pseudouridine(38-40) synthase TruA [Pseudomonadota bacterium]MBU2480584.1 tRNA pseudouridine(38-40) synthase TruA [Pseudomonadota bacterium]
MKKNHKITIEYDGTSFYGWQKQKDQITIQGEIEAALSRILNQDIAVCGSGRTDAGVHALGQVASFHADTTLLPQTLKKNFNSFIKLPIVIKDCHIVSTEFHARFSAVSKEYYYFIFNSFDPCAINRQYQWHIRQELDLQVMNDCCRAITGTFDFKSFENSGSPRDSTIRQIYACQITKIDHQRLVFKICGNGFLKYMVRNLIGTIVNAGLHKITVQDFVFILQQKDRKKAGVTAPPHGLFLNRVNYM